MACLTVKKVSQLQVDDGSPDHERPLKLLLFLLSKRGAGVSSYKIEVW
jgi:hypothetical protein